MSKLTGLSLLLTALVCALPATAQDTRATAYSVTIIMDEETVGKLQKGNYSLYGYKALAGPGAGAPTVWFSIPADRLTAKTRVSWEERYQAYVSDTAIVNDVQIHATNETPIDLGQEWNVEKTGFGPVAQGGPGWIGVRSVSERAWTTGISQAVNGKSSIIAAFPLYGHHLDRMQPIQKVLFMFATEKISTGTVNFQSYGPSLMIDLTGVDTRSVEYKINANWSCLGNVWCQSYGANADLQKLLIDSSRSIFDPVSLNDTVGAPVGECFAQKGCRGDDLGAHKQNKCYSKSIGGRSWKAPSGRCYDK